MYFDLCGTVTSPPVDNFNELYLRAKAMHTDPCSADSIKNDSDMLVSSLHYTCMYDVCGS
jgi:hypothetical protein